MVGTACGVPRSGEAYTGFADCCLSPGMQGPPPRRRSHSATPADARRKLEPAFLPVLRSEALRTGEENANVRPAQRRSGDPSDATLAVRDSSRGPGLTHGEPEANPRPLCTFPLLEPAHTAD